MNIVIKYIEDLFHQVKYWRTYSPYPVRLGSERQGTTDVEQEGLKRESIWVEFGFNVEHVTE